MPYEADGAQMYGGRQPAGYIGKDNTLWFPTKRGAAHVLPAPGQTATVPLVHITGLAQDGRSLPAASSVTVAARATRLDVNFLSLFLGSQRGLRFRYMLQGFDHAWVQAGSVHTATYTNLPPRSFRFRLVAFNTIDEARDMAWKLRHTEEIDLASSLHAFARQASEAFGIPVAYTDPASPGMISPLAGHEVLMITREALPKSAPHGNPDTITIALSRSAEFRKSISPTTAVALRRTRPAFRTGITA